MKDLQNNPSYSKVCCLNGQTEIISDLVKNILQILAFQTFRRIYRGATHSQENQGLIDFVYILRLYINLFAFYNLELF